MSQSAFLQPEIQKLNVPAPADLIGVETPDLRPMCPPAASSFAVGLVALRVCWLPGINMILALLALVLGVIGLWRITHSRGALSGLDEAISGVVLAVVVLGLSIFFLSLIIAAYRG